MNRETQQDIAQVCPHYRAEVSYRNKQEAPVTRRGVDGVMRRYTFWALSRLRSLVAERGGAELSLSAEVLDRLTYLAEQNALLRENEERLRSTLAQIHDDYHANSFDTTEDRLTQYGRWAASAVRPDGCSCLDPLGSVSV